MKKSNLFLSAVLFISINAFAQAPGIRWSRLYSPAPTTIYYDAKPTSDRGFVAVGTDNAFGYDKYSILKKFYGNKGLIVKMDSAGNTQWFKTQGAAGDAIHYQSVVVTDGNYVAGGLRVNGSTQPFDSSNFYLVKFDALGNILWQKTYGGTKTEAANCMIKTNTGGFVLAGHTNSNDGDVTGNHSANYTDAWLIKTNSSGDLIWKKCFGGTLADTAYKVIQTSDKGFVVAGSSGSSNGNLTGNNGLTDGWLFKTDSLGNLIWQKNYGGTSHDVLNDVVENADGSFTVTGYTSSSGINSNGQRGGADFWVMKVSATGTVIWSKGYGGTNTEAGMSIANTQEGSWIIGGYTESSTMDVVGNNGAADAWVIKISATGDLVWQKCAGGSRDEFAFALMVLSEDDFVFAGMSQESTINFDGRGYFVRLGNTAHFKANIISANPVTGGLITLNGSGFNYTLVPGGNSNIIDVDTGSYIGSATPVNSNYTINPSNFNVNFPAYFDTVVMNFTISPIPGRRDLVVNAIPITPARPGFAMSYRLYYKNVGTDTVTSGQLLFKRDPRLIFSSASPAVSSVSGDTLKWNYTNLKPFDSVSVLVNMQAQVPPALNINDTLVSYTFITPIAGDLTPADDTAVIRQRVTGSFDPNDKSESGAGLISAQQIANGTYINYLIRFQNTGNDTAFNVVVRDTLDTKLNWATIQMIGASHPNSFQITDQNKLAWYFNNIKLPDSNRNEPLSHGYVAYRVKANTNLSTGDNISNTASIYFDYNLPVRTNTQLTTVVNNIVTGINDPVVDHSSMLLFPNPTADQIWIRIKERVQGRGQLFVMDLNGKIIYQEDLGRIDLTNYQKSVYLDKIAAGSYIISLHVAKKLFVQKLVIQ